MKTQAAARRNADPGSVAFVTGANRGIGLEVTRQLLERAKGERNCYRRGRKGALSYAYEARHGRVGMKCARKKTVDDCRKTALNSGLGTLAPGQRVFTTREKACGMFSHVIVVVVELLSFSFVARC